MLSAYEHYVGWQLLTMLYSALLFLFVLYPLSRGVGWSLFRCAVVATIVGGCLAYWTMSELEPEDEPTPAVAPATT